MTERELQDAVIDLARTCGWRVAHFRPARTDAGWRTAVAADGTGYPDLTLVHPIHGVWFVECKSDRGQLTPDQIRWADALLVAGANWRLWRPANWPEIVNTLSGGRATAGPFVGVWATDGPPQTTTTTLGEHP